MIAGRSYSSNMRLECYNIFSNPGAFLGYVGTISFLDGWSQLQIEQGNKP